MSGTLMISLHTASSGHIWLYIQPLPAEVPVIDQPKTEHLLGQSIGWDKYNK